MLCRLTVVNVNCLKVRSFPFRLAALCFVFLPPLLPRVELGEAVADDGDGKADDEDAKDGAEAAEDLAEAGDRADVAVPHRCHSDDCPPIGVKHCLESCFRIFFLKDKYEGGKHDGPHPQQQEEEAELLVVGLHGVAEGLEAGGVPRQLEDPDDPQRLHDSSHLQKPEVLGGPTNISLAIG